MFAVQKYHHRPHHWQIPMPERGRGTDFKSNLLVKLHFIFQIQDHIFIEKCIKALTEKCRFQTTTKIVFSCYFYCVGFSFDIFQR